MQSFRTREIPSMPKHSADRRERGRLAFSVAEFTISRERLLGNNLCSCQIARLHDDVSKIGGRIRRVPTIMGCNVQLFGFLEGSPCPAQLSEIGKSAAFHKLCACDQKLCPPFSPFGDSTHGHCLLTSEIRECAGGTRFRNIDSRVITIRRGEFSQCFNGCEPVLRITCGGLSISQTQTVIEIIGKEAK